jgi:RimJ/RimL family protein N-acetyltransferase
MTTPPELSSPRLLLRQWNSADYHPFAALCADPEVMQFFISSVIDSATAHAKIDKWSRLLAINGWGFWALESKTDREFVGFAGLQVPAQDHPYMPCVEIGWRLARKFWGRGYATEAARTVLDYAFENLSMIDVIATTAVGNTRSNAVMERLGMHGPEATFQFPGVPASNPLGTCVLYRVSRQQWKARNAA